MVENGEYWSKTCIGLIAKCGRWKCDSVITPEPITFPPSTFHNTDALSSETSVTPAFMPGITANTRKSH